MKFLKKLLKNEINSNINSKVNNKKNNKEKKLLKKNLANILEDSRLKNNPFNIDYYDYVTGNPLFQSLLNDKKGLQTLLFKIDFRNNHPMNTTAISINFNNTNNIIEMDETRKILQKNSRSKLEKYILELISVLVKNIK